LNENNLGFEVCKKGNLNLSKTNGTHFVKDRIKGEICAVGPDIKKQVNLRKKILLHETSNAHLYGKNYS
jgi:hypothetical protein